MVTIYVCLTRTKLILGDIVPPPPPDLRPETLIARIQTLENEIKQIKQRHEETLKKFKSTSKVWREGTKRLAMTANPVQDVMAIRVDGVAAAAKDAESAVALEMTQPSHATEIEQINKQVLAECGIPNARIRVVEKVRPVGKPIHEQLPIKTFPAQPPGPISIHAPQSTGKPVPPSAQEQAPVEAQIEQEVDLDSEIMDEDGHANEAFEAMEAMEFNASFDYDSENHGNNDMTLDMGVD